MNPSELVVVNVLPLTATVSVLTLPTGAQSVPLPGLAVTVVVKALPFNVQERVSVQAA